MIGKFVVLVVSVSVLFTFQLAEARDVVICHKPGTPAEQLLRVPKPALPAHLRHGDFVGSSCNLDHYTVPVTAFNPENDNADYSLLYNSGTSAPSLQCNSTSNDKFYAPVYLPTGALVTGFTVFGSNGGTSTSWGLYQSCHNPEDTTDLLIEIQTSTISGEYGTGDTLKERERVMVNNASCQYFIRADMAASSCDGTTKIRKARINYSRQNSPPPVLATFFDVPETHPFFAAIEALVASGITGGCGGGNYCPDDSLTRGQMAAFLARALKLN